jgi:F-type H+-transporting ATPase subunit a
MTFFVKPFSLGLRLFCNIFSKELFLAILALLLLQFLHGPTAMDKIFTMAPLVLRPIIVLLGVVIGFIQALVFLVLTISYIAGARSAAEHG